VRQRSRNLLVSIISSMYPAQIPTCTLNPAIKMSLAVSGATAGMRPSAWALYPTPMRAAPLIWVAIVRVSMAMKTGHSQPARA